MFLKCPNVFTILDAIIPFDLLILDKSACFRTYVWRLCIYVYMLYFCSFQVTCVLENLVC